MKLPSRFDGNYYKIKIDKLNTHLIIIQGRNDKDKSGFIQYAFEGDLESTYHSFSIAEFQKKDNVIYVGNNIFAPHLIHLDLPNLRLSLKITKENITGKDSSINTMGKLKNIPFVQCKHEILSLSKECEMSLNNYNDINLKSTGKIYIERNWGNSFPSEYFWMHCCDYLDDELLEFQFAAAKPKFLGLKPKVHLGVLKYKNSLYQYGEFKNSKMKIINHSQLNNSMTFSVENSNSKLLCSINQGFFTNFISPSDEGMKGEISESLNSLITINFDNGVNSFEFSSKNASAELVNLNNF